MKKQSQEGFAKIAIGIALAVVAALAVYYFTSDVGKTRIDAAHKEYAKWTPTNIAKDPENYLNFCEAQCDKALLTLKASEIEIAQKRGEIKRMSDEANTAAKAGEKLLGEIKAAYTAADENDSFPFAIASLANRTFDRETAKREIMNVHRQTEGKKQIAAQTDAAVRQLDVNNQKITEARMNLNQQKTEIAAGRTTVKIGKITDDLTKRLSNIGSSVYAISGIVTDTSAPINLDSFVTSQAGSVDDDEFAKIMGL